MTSIHRLISPTCRWRAATSLLAALAWIGLAQPPATAAQPAVTCEALVRAETALDQQAYRAVVATASPGDEQSALTIIEAIGTERAHIFSRGVEFLMVGAATYARQGGSEWQLLPIDMWNLAEQAKAGLSQGTCETSPPVPQDLDGLATDVYGFAIQDLDRGTSTRGTMWVGTDGLARRLEVEAEVEGIVFIRAVVYDYDPSLSIEEP